MEETLDNPAGSCEPAPAQETRRIVVEQHGLHALLVLEGQIDLEAAADLRVEAERLLAGSDAVAVDWRAAAHVCPGAVQVLLSLEAELSARSRALRVVRDNPDVRRFLELAGLSGRFPVEQTA